MAAEKQIVLYNNETACCGCAACANICPKNAIQMRENADGYVYPEIIQTSCIHCGLCQKVCSYQNGIAKHMPLVVKAASATQQQLLQNVSSGGIFSLLARAVLKTDGVVYGAAYQDGLQVVHRRIDKQEELILLQGSKYTQSTIGTSYQTVKADLKTGRPVLFSGTPCQIGGLKGYLGKEYDNLYTIDVVCHGVPNQKQFQSFLKYLGKKYNGTITDFSFRDKRRGWTDYYTVFSVNNREKNEYCKTQAYYSMFLQSDICRSNCYSCPYACGERIGDITLGDFWGFQEVHAELCTDPAWQARLKKGISCVLLNTDKGIALYDRISTDILCADSSYEKASKANGQLRHPSPLSKKREIILKIWREQGYEAVQKYFKRQMGLRYYYIALRKKAAGMIKGRLKK